MTTRAVPLAVLLLVFALFAVPAFAQDEEAPAEGEVEEAPDAEPAPDDGTADEPAVEEGVEGDLEAPADDGFVDDGFDQEEFGGFDDAFDEQGGGLGEGGEDIVPILFGASMAVIGLGAVGLWAWKVRTSSS